MEVSELYTYPVKSLQGTPLTKAQLTRNGFLYDRRFMLLKVHHDGQGEQSERRYENMHVAYFPEMTLFFTDISFPSEEEDGSITITCRPPHGAEAEKRLELTLEPDTAELEIIKIVMHNSPTQGYDMGARYSEWFSARFGFEVVLAYLGENLRPVLGNLSPNITDVTASKQGGWLSSIAAKLPFLGAGDNDPEGITFADCAPLLVVSETSLQNVSHRLPDGTKMDITKFRPNIVVKGAANPFDEDFWAEISIKGLEVVFTANCVRCQSINIDYTTGKPGTGEEGQILKKLQKDRRVDKGAKYSPVFGRYGFLPKGRVGGSITVGDPVVVTELNSEHTVFQWPGLGSRNPVAS